MRCERLEEPARFGDECRDSKTDPVVQFGPDGKVVKSFGGGMFIWPHGLDVDKEGNVWVTDAVATNRIPKGDKRGQHRRQVQPEGKVLLTLGTPGEQGGGPTHFTSPSDVVVAPNGDMFIADGHDETGNNRIVHFSKDGKFVQGLGQDRLGAGRVPRASMPSRSTPRGRIFVGDRGNNRIQIFDQDGKSLSVPWTQFGKPSGIAFDASDQIYVADSESDDVQNPGWEEGIRIGDAKTGWVNAFILLPLGRSADDGRQRRGVRGCGSRRETSTAASRRRSGCRSTCACGRSRTRSA